MIELGIVEIEDRRCLGMLDLSIEPERAIKVRYKNWREEVSIRRIIPTGRIYFDTTSYHSQKPQWLMEVLDLDNDYELRHFAMTDILEFIKE